MIRSVFLLFILLSQSHAFGFVERRATTSGESAFGYMIYPVVGRVGGIGFAYGAAALVQNIADSSTDVSVFGFTGDAEAGGITVNNIKIADFFSLDSVLFSTRLPVRFYERGMSSNSTDFYRTLVRETGGSAVARFRFWENRIQFFGRFGSSTTQINRIYAANGDEFYNLDDRAVPTAYSRIGALLDFTDSSGDPRKGLKLEATRTEAFLSDPSLSKSHAWHYSAFAFIPLGDYSTWGFNAYRSKAYVDAPSTLTEAELRQRLSLNCSAITDVARRTVCQEAEDRRVQERLAGNRLGNSGYLGGTSHLRGYPVNRFRASDTVFYASELRWNITNEESPMDFFFMKGVRTNIQLALFNEWGAVADSPVNVEKVPLRPSSGLGLRLLFSGAVVRADVGFSEEGSEVHLFFGYPWGIPVL